MGSRSPREASSGVEKTFHATAIAAQTILAQIDQAGGPVTNAVVGVRRCIATGLTMEIMWPIVLDRPQYLRLDAFRARLS
jgi:hypothetical protein